MKLYTPTENTAAALEVFEQLAARVRPFLEDYHDDLEKHDRNLIMGRPGIPFLHVTRKWGTHLQPFSPLEDYPAPGEKVRYLFGYSDRDRLLQNVEDFPRIFGQDTETGKWGVDYLFFTYYDPAAAGLKTVTRAAALALTRDYAETVRRSWYKARAIV